MSNRRGFLRLLAAAPIAAPVAAREAASKAGVSSMSPHGLTSLGFASGVSESPTSEGDWATKWCKQVFSKAWEDERREEAKRYRPARLDADLASSRSLSLSAAMRIQAERDIERDIQAQRQNARRRYFSIFNMEWAA